MVYSHQPAAQHRLQLTPLARPQTWRVFHACRVPPAVAFKEAASGALEAQRWAAESRRSSFHGGANQNQTHILYTHARKRLSEPSERDRGVNCFTSEYEISRPNHQTYSEASIVVHLNMKYPVRTIRHTQRRQSFYT